MEQYPFNSHEFSTPSTKIITETLNYMETNNIRDFSISDHSIIVNFVPFLINNIDADEYPTDCAEALMHLARYTNARINTSFEEPIFTEDPHFEISSLPENMQIAAQRMQGRLPSSPAFIGELIVDTIRTIQVEENRPEFLDDNISAWKAISLGVLVELYKDLQQPQN